MAEHLKHIDVTNAPDLLRLAEEVRRNNEPLVLSRDSEELAVITPVTTKRHAKRARTQADREAFLSSAGAWNGLVDTEQLKRDIAESRRISTRPPVEL